MCVAAPIGLLTAINLSEYASQKVRKTAHFSFLNNLYLKMLPVKLITKKRSINSNHQALYIIFLAASIPYQLSIKVPKAIAVGNIINRIAVNLLEKINEYILSFIYILKMQR